jgi:plastocyanin domain-containing protein
MTMKPYVLAVLAAFAVPALAQPPAQAKPAIAEGTVKEGVRTFEMKVTDDGFVPSRVKVKKGEKVRFVITRTTDRTCATEIQIEGTKVNEPLPLGKAVTVEFTPAKSGEIKYACAMGHVGGVVFVP